jgi:ribosomal-protein-alanine N-acetyltransferase
VKAPETILTERLTLRRPVKQDAELIFHRYSSDPEVTVYVGWPRQDSVHQTEAFITFSDSEWEQWPAGPYLVFSQENGMLLGGTGLAFESPTKASTGYVFAKDSWGKGYATECLRAMVRLAQSLTLERLYATCHVDHQASSHVLEKCGFIREGILPKHTIFPNLSPTKRSDVLCYALLFLK